MWKFKNLVILILSYLSLSQASTFAACTFQQVSEPSSQFNYYGTALNVQTTVSISGLVTGDNVTCQAFRTRPPAAAVSVSCSGGFTANNQTPISNFEVPFGFATASSVANDAGYYTFDIAATCGGVTTHYISQAPGGLVTVNPTISTQPQNLTLAINAQGSMNVLANNDTNSSIWTYKWKFGGTNITAGQGYTGFNTRTLTFTTPQTLLKTSQYYSVQVENPFGQQWGYNTSSSAEFHLSTSNPSGDGLCRSTPGFISGPNSYDNFNNSGDGIVQLAGYFQIYNGNYFNGIGDCSDNGGGLFYCYDAGRTPTNFYIQVSNPLIMSSDIDYLKNTSIVGSFADQYATQPFEIYSDDNAQAGDAGNYSIRVNNGPCQTTAVNSSAVAISVVQAPVATVDVFMADTYDNTNIYMSSYAAPATATAVQGGATYFNVSVSGTGPFTYQLVKDGVNFGSAIGPTGSNSANFSIPFPTLTTAAHQGAYVVRVTNSGGTVASPIINLVVNPVPPTAVYIAGNVQRPEGSQMIYTGVVIPPEASGLSYQWQSSPNQSSWTTVATTPEYSFTTGAPGTTYYRLRVQNSTIAPAWVTSNISTFISVAAAPSISFQPQSSSVVDGQAYQFQVVASGSPTLSYLWERRANASSPFIQVGGNSPIFSANAQLIDSGAQFRVTVSNTIAPNAVSNIVNLTVAAAAPVVLTQPVSQTVAENSSVSFSASASGSAPFSYQWQKSTNGGANYTNISTGEIASAQSQTLQFTATNAMNGYKYRVVISNAAGNVTTAAATLTVTPAQAACTAPSQVILSSPSNNIVSAITRSPTMTWQAVSPVSGCGLSYQFQLSTDPSFTGTPTIDIGGTIYNVGIQNPSTIYHWRVRAVATISNSSTPGPWSAVWSFLTIADELGAPTNLYTLPSSSPENPAGNQQIILGAFNGTAGATGVFYLKQPSGDVEVASTTIGNAPGGNFQVSINVTAFGASNGPREYYARQIRENPPAQGPVSSSVIYFYDSSVGQALMPPALEKNNASITGSLKWNRVENADRYYIYRRVGLQLPTQNLYQLNSQSKPFEKVADIVNPTSGVVTWADPSVPALDANGISYFVTSVKLAPSLTQSVRSNSQSFSDSTPPKRSREVSGGNLYVQQFEFETLSSGRSALGYLLGVPFPPGFFHRIGYTQPLPSVCATPGVCDYYENSPDLIAQVQVKIKSVATPCENENFSVNAQSYQMAFDALNVVNNKISIGEIGNLEPNTIYCFKACLKDLSDNGEGSACLDAAAFQVGPDELPPDFAGVKEVLPSESGTGLNVTWDPPTLQQQIQEPITYLATATEKFDVDGLPIFDSESILRQVDGTATGVLIDGLKTNKQYAVRVAAIDQAQNEAGNSVFKKSQTLNNYPWVPKVIVASDSSEPWKMKIQFEVLDRQQDEVQIEAMAYRTNKNEDWTPINSQNISGNSFFESGDSLESAPTNETIFDTLPYFSGQQPGFQVQLKVVDIQGNETYAESEQSTAFLAKSKYGSFVSYSGCTSMPAGQSGSGEAAMLILLTLIGLAAFVRKSNLHKSH